MILLSVSWQKKPSQVEEKYRLLVDNANDGVFIAQDGRIKFPNPKVMQILGYTADELAGIHYLDLVSSC